jgi:carbonic anhydrase
VIFDASPGELFVVRNVANLVPPYETGGEYHGTSAALEFAVQALRVKHIVVLGHARCGGVRAFADDTAPLSPGDFIGRWMTLIAPAAERLGPRQGSLDEYVAKLELAAIENSLRNLMTFPCVRILVERGKLQLHGAFFGVASGVLMVRNPETGAFQPAVEDMPERISTIRCG